MTRHLLLFFTIIASANLVSAQAIRVVDGGKITINSTVNCPSSTVVVEAGSSIEISDGGTLTANELRIEQLATVRCCGVLQIDQIENLGQLLSDCGFGQSFVISGILVNQGLVRISQGTSFLMGAVENRGVFDAITASTPAGDVVNTDGGRTFDSEAPGNLGFSYDGTTATLTMESLSGHNYQVQISQSRDLENWVNVAELQQPGSGSILTFTVPATIDDQRSFFRIAISD